ncbi:hypothetical protein [Arthrobacter sp. OY3WO11]|uniref:hypothetical protein n=1 Tax=Arthrobacter sp. OY3WO11 TaxID=1835723 RepID=UPI0012E8843B|nr:hypothetical protein [Arthrobacter sp. OY3WO11]
MAAAVEEALEAARSGQAFAARYTDSASLRFRQSAKWIVRVGDVEVDSKALLAAAYKNQFGRDLSEKIYGGTDVVVRTLARFGHKLELRQDAQAGAPPHSGTWVTSPGDDGSKQDFSDLYGGSTRGGIQPSAKTPNVLLYSDPAVGVTYGYNFDGWSEDGKTYSYTGEGRRGPQTLKSGNGAILRHKEQGRALRLFVVDGEEVAETGGKNRVYIGEFSLDEEHPYSIEDAKDVEGVLRTVYVFHLKPVGDVLRRDEDLSVAPMAPRRDARAQQVPLENQNSTTFATSGSEPAVAEKREQQLVDAFQEVLATRGHAYCRWQITPPESTRPLFTDVYDETSGILYEAKSEASRNNVRLGLGQILDYRRYLPGVQHFSLLLPAAPHIDLLDLLASYHVGAVWRDPGTGVFMQHVREQTMPF